MHPLFSSGKTFAAFSGLWLILCALTGMLLGAQFDMEWQPILFWLVPWLYLFYFFCFSNFYLCKWLLTERVKFTNAAIGQVVATIITVWLWLWLGQRWAEGLDSWLPAAWPLISPLFDQAKPTLIVVGTLLYGFWILSHYLYLLAYNRQNLATLDLQKKLLISESELQNTKSTIHPHFLYNSLNMLANVSLSSPEKVHSLCLQIADFLRYSVQYSRKQYVVLADELAHVQNYLGIERERFGKRLNTEFDIDEQALSMVVIPLMLFPLIENSVKHGIDSLMDGGTIRLRIAKQQHGVEIEVSNSYDPLGRKSTGTGFGLTALKKRLTAEYGNLVQLRVKREENQFSVALFIPEKDQQQLLLANEFNGAPQDS